MKDNTPWWKYRHTTWMDEETWFERKFRLFYPLVTFLTCIGSGGWLLYDVHQDNGPVTNANIVKAVVGALLLVAAYAGNAKKDLG